MGIPDEKVVSLIANGILGRMTRMIPQFAGYEIKAGLLKKSIICFQEGLLTTFLKIQIFL